METGTDGLSAGPTVQNAVAPDSGHLAVQGSFETGAVASAAATRWVEIAPQSRVPRIDIGELWAYREVARALVLRDVKLRYKQTIFGVAWALIQPLTAAAIFTVVFGRLAKLPSDGIPYAVFVYAGLALWTYHSTAVQSASECLVENNKLVTNVYFSRLLAPLAAVIPGLLDLVVSLVILAGFMAVYGVAPAWAIVVAPLWALAAVLLAFGAGTLLCGLNVLYRDVRYAFPFVLQIWLFASPVVFPGSLLTGNWRYVFAANPMVGLLDVWRWSLLDGAPPGRADFVSLGAGLLILAVGVVYFRRVERHFADRM